jgi:hypothetical protein
VIAGLFTFGVQIKDLADDLPFSVGLEQGEHIGEFVAGPVVEF